MESLSSSILQNTVNASQQEINTLLKQLQTGLKINSSADDPANLYVSDKLNLKALEDASTASNAQSGLTYLQVAQKAYSDIVTQLNKINDLANLALKGGYTDSQLSDFQDKITESINAIKLIETGTMFNGIQVFDNQNSVGLVNEHLFAITSKTDVTITTATLIDNRGKDFSAYLSNPTIHRYEKQDVGGTITLKNDLGATLTPGANLVTIENAAQLVSALSSTVTAGRTFILLDNIDLSSLGTKTAALISGTFLGTLEGNGYEISGLQVNSTTADNVGLFERLGAGATVQNVILKDFSVKGDQEVGALAGGDGGATISNVAVLDANVQGNFEVGGLVGFAGGGALIQNVYATGNVYGDSVSTSLGGLVGRNGTMSHVYNSFANVDVTGGNKVGGIVGDNVLGGVVSESYARGDVIGKTNVGGLVGSNAVGASVINTYSLGTVTGQTNTAGLVGNNLGTVTNSYSLSAVKDSTTTYDIANFQVAATSEVVAGSAERPNDAFSITFDYAGKTYAFDTIDNFNKFKNFTLGTPSGEVDLLYEKDATTNTWYGRKLQATNQYSYAASALPDAVVNGVPEDNNGVSFSVITTIAAGGHAAAGTYAFKNEADKNSFLTFNTTNTTITNIDKFYKLDAPNNKWDSQALTVNASTYAVSAGTSASYANTPLSNYGIFNDLWTDTAGLHGAANTVYAFTNEADKNAFMNGNAKIGLFYKANADNTWSALKQDISVAATYSYAVQDLSTTVSDDPQDDLNHYVYMTADGKNAFASQEDLNNFNDGTNFLGEIAKYYSRTATDTWYAKKIAKTVTSSYSSSASGAPVVSSPIDADGVNYTFVKDVSGSTYAFATQTDFDNFNNGTPIGVIGAYYKKIAASDGLSNAWEKYQVTKTPGTVTYTPTAIVGADLDSAPKDPDGVNYNISRTLNAGVDVYRFASQQDADNFNDGITFLGAVSKYYKYDSAKDAWQAQQVRPNVAAVVTPTQLDTANSAPLDDSGVIYNIFKSVNGFNYAFSSQTDANNFVDDTHFLASIGKYYKDMKDTTTCPWQGLSVTAQANATITAVGSSVHNAPLSSDGISYSLISGSTDGHTYAFASQTDVSNFNLGNYKGDIGKFYQLNGDNVTWTEMTVKGTPVVTRTDTGVSVPPAPIDADGDEYSYLTNWAGGGHGGWEAFKSEADYNAYKTAAHDVTYYTIDTTDPTPVWHQYYYSQGTQSTVIQTPQNYAPIAPIDTKYNVIADIGGKHLAFASEEDKLNYHDGYAFRANIDKYYVYSSTSKIWEAMSVVKGFAKTGSSILSDYTHLVDVNSGHGSNYFSYEVNDPVYGSKQVFYSKADYDTWKANGETGVYYFQLSTYMSTANWVGYDSTGAQTGTRFQLTPSDYLYTSSLWSSPDYEFGSARLAFFSDADRTTYNYGSPYGTPIIDFYKYNDNSGLWDSYSYSTAGFAFGLPETLQSIPLNDPDYSTQLNFSYTDTSAVVHTGTAYFANASDKQTYQYYLTTLDPNVSDWTIPEANFNYYLVDSSSRMQEYSFNSYKAWGSSLSGVQAASKPSDSTFKYRVDVSAGSGYASGTYWLSSPSDVTLFNQINAHYAGGGAPLPQQDFSFNCYYQPRFTDNDQNWELYTFTNKVTYTNTAGATNIKDKPADSLFNYKGTDTDGNVYFFANQADADTYLNYKKTIADGKDNQAIFDLYYYNTNGSGTWQKNHAVSAAQASGSSWGYLKPDDTSYNIGLNGTYNPGTKASGSGLYYFESNADKAAFLAYVGGSQATFDITYYFMSDADVAANTRTWNKKELLKSNPLTKFDLEDTAHEDPSKPKSSTYSVLSTYGGGQYWFATEGEKQTFEKYKGGLLDNTNITFSDIYYYTKSGAGTIGNWKENKLSSIVTPDKYNNIDTTTKVNSRPNDPNYGLPIVGTYATATPSNLADASKYIGTFYFKSVEDQNIFDKVRQGTESGDITNVYYYKFNTATKNWDRNVLSSTTSTSFGSADYQVAETPHTGSPSVLGYEKVWTDVAHSNEYAFNSDMDKSNFQKYISNTLSANVDIFYYQRITGTDTWAEKRLTSNLGSDSYAVTARPADNTIGRPEKDGYDILSADGLKAFANANDLATYNAGTPTGAINLFYQYNAVSKKWDAYQTTKNTDTYANTATGIIVDGRPDEEDYGTISKIGGTFYAFKDATDSANFASAIAQGWGVANATKIAGIDRYYEYTPGTNKWQAKKVSETTTQTYGIVAKATPNIAGLAERPTADGYNYLTTIAAGGNAGTYAFKSADDRTSFLNYAAGNGTVNPITNYYKLNVTNKLADLVSGKLIDSWDGQKLEYDNNTGYLIGKNTGTITGSFYGNGEASANYVDDGVTILGNAQIAADALPISGWSAAIWDTTSTSKPILKNTKSEGSEDIKEANLTELLDETKYVYHIYDSYATNDIRLNTAVTSGSFTAAVPASAPVGVDAAGRPLVATVNLTGLAGKYASNITVSDNANSSIKYSEGKDFVVYTNDNGASWKMDILSSSMYSKTIKVDYTAASTASVDQANSGFNVYLGDNKSLMVKDMTLDLAGRLNFNVTRSGEVNGAIDAMKEVLEYMKHKQAEVSGEITVATNALNNKTSQNKTKTNAISNILSVDEAKAKAELAKQQLLQSKTDQILQKFYDLQTSTMQALLSSSFNSSASGYGGIYQGLTGVNNLYNKNIVDYNYKNLYGTSSSN